MLTVNSEEINAPLSSLLEQVTKGEQVTITQHGIPIARIVPVSETDRAAVGEVIEQIKEFQKAHRLNGLSIRDMINEGRKY